MRLHRMIASPVREAQSGDIWLYRQTDPVSRIVAIKTWSRFTHVELIFRDPTVRAFTARLPQGVAFYPPDLRDLALVLRPTPPFDAEAAASWAESVVGQPYDVLGIAAFFVAEWQGRENGRMFCSEAVARCLRRGAVDLFPGADCDRIPPSYFGVNPLVTVVWRSPDEWRRWYAWEAA